MPESIFERLSTYIPILHVVMFSETNAGTVKLVGVAPHNAAVYMLAMFIRSLNRNTPLIFLKSLIHIIRS